MSTPPVDDAAEITSRVLLALNSVLFSSAVTDGACLILVEDLASEGRPASRDGRRGGPAS
jgi:hypothetical protein